MRPARPSPGEGGPPRVGASLADLDALALALLAAGNARAAAEEVLRVHGESVRRFLRGTLRDGDAADDAFSLWSEWTVAGIGRFQGASSLRAWSFGVARNAARRIRDDAFRRRRCSLRRGAISRLPAPRRSSSARRAEHAAATLEDIRRRLSTEEQELLALRIDQGLDWEEVATVLTAGADPVTCAALRKRFERLKRRIRHIADQMGGLG